MKSLGLKYILISVLMLVMSPGFSTELASSEYSTSSTRINPPAVLVQISQDMAELNSLRIEVPGNNHLMPQVTSPIENEEETDESISVKKRSKGGMPFYSTRPSMKSGFETSTFSQTSLLALSTGLSYPRRHLLNQVFRL